MLYKSFKTKSIFLVVIKLNVFDVNVARFGKAFRVYLEFVLESYKCGRIETSGNLSEENNCNYHVNLIRILGTKQYLIIECIMNVTVTYISG